MLHSCNFDILLFLETSYACHITFFYSQFHMKFSILTLLCLSSYMLLITIAIVIIVLVFLPVMPLLLSLVLVMICLGGQFGINIPSAFLKILKLAKQNFRKLRG